MKGDFLGWQIEACGGVASGSMHTRRKEEERRTNLDPPMGEEWGLLAGSRKEVRGGETEDTSKVSGWQVDD